MAKLVAKKALDMSAWDNLFDDSSGADIGEHDNNHFIATTDHHTFTVTGEEFDYEEIDDDIVPTDGTVHTFSAAEDGKTLFNITKMAEDATTLAQYVATEDWDAFASDFFSGKDKIVGSRHDDFMRGFFGADKISGGKGNDTILGDAGGDTLAGGAGADHFNFNEASDSPLVTPDAIVDFDAGADVIGLKVDVTNIENSIANGTLSKNHFGDDLEAQIGNGELGLHSAVLFGVNDGGAYDGHVFLVVNLNGTAGYQAGPDLVLDVTGISGTLGTDNFEHT
jgi:Ca2+-binding RTX toxin-like protein